MDSSIPSSQKKNIAKASEEARLCPQMKFYSFQFSSLPITSAFMFFELHEINNKSQLWMCAPNETSSISQWLAASEFSICLKIDSKPMRLRKLLRKAGFGCETCSRLGSKNSRALCIIVHYRLMISHLLLSATTSRSTMTCSELIRDTICAKIRHNPISAQVKEVRATNRH